MPDDRITDEHYVDDASLPMDVKAWVGSLEKQGLRRPLSEYEKAHTYPVSQPFWDSLTPEKWFASWIDERLPKQVKEKQGGYWGYIHVPFCGWRCRFCFYDAEALNLSDVSSCSTMFDNYLGALEREIGEARRRLFKADGHMALSAVSKIPLRDLYVGGGTPTALTPAHLERLLKIVRDNFEWSDENFLATCECSPGTLTPDKVQELKKMGFFNVFRRISIGMQSECSGHLAFSDRAHNVDDAFATYWLLRDFGLEHINVDLMYGFPGGTHNEGESATESAWNKQSPKDWSRSLASILQRFRTEGAASAPEGGDGACFPESITCYYLRYVPGSAFDRDIPVNKRVEWAELVEMRREYFRQLSELKDADGQFVYERCRPHFFRKRNNPSVLRYRGAPTLDHANEGTQLGFGPSAYSHVGFWVAQNARSEVEWRKLVTERVDACAVQAGRLLTLQDQYTRTVIKALLEEKEVYSVDFAGDERMLDRLNKLCRMGLITCSPRSSSSGKGEPVGEPVFRLTQNGVLVDEELCYFIYPRGFVVPQKVSFSSGSLLLGNRVCQIQQFASMTLQSEDWFNKALASVEAPGFCSEAWVRQIVCEMWDTWLAHRGVRTMQTLLEDANKHNSRGEYNKIESQVLDWALNNALCAVSLESGCNDDYGKPGGGQDCDDAMAPQEPTGLFDWAKKYASGKNLNLIAPGLAKDESGYQFDLSAGAPHFGSFSFHEAHIDHDGVKIQPHKPTYANIPLDRGDMGFDTFIQAKQDAAEDVDAVNPLPRACRKWVSDLIEECVPERMDDNWMRSSMQGIAKEFLGEFALEMGKKGLWRDEIEKLSDRKLFQQVVSRLLQRKQSQFLGDIGAIVPLVLIRLMPKTGETRRVDIQFSAEEHERTKLDNVVEVVAEEGAAERLMLSYIANVGDCPRARQDRGSAVSSCEKCKPFCRLLRGIEDAGLLEQWDKALARFGVGLGAFVKKYANDVRKRSAQSGAIQTEWGRADFIELLFPLVFFRQPILISCQYTRVADVGAKFDSQRGQISSSFAFNPFGTLDLEMYPSVADNLDANARRFPRRRSREGVALRKWAVVVAGHLHALTTGVSDLITEIDERSKTTDNAALAMRTQLHRGWSHALKNALLPIHSASSLLQEYGVGALRDMSRVLFGFYWNVFQRAAERDDAQEVLKGRSIARCFEDEICGAIGETAIDTLFDITRIFSDTDGRPSTKGMSDEKMGKLNKAGENLLQVGFDCEYRNLEAIPNALSGLDRRISDLAMLNRAVLRATDTTKDCALVFDRSSDQHSGAKIVRKGVAVALQTYFELLGRADSEYLRSYKAVMQVNADSPCDASEVRRRLAAFATLISPLLEERIYTHDLACVALDARGTKNDFPVRIVVSIDSDKEWRDKTMATGLDGDAATVCTMVIWEACLNALKHFRPHEEGSRAFLNLTLGPLATASKPGFTLSVCNSISRSRSEALRFLHKKWFRGSIPPGFASALDRGAHGHQYTGLLSNLRYVERLGQLGGTYSDDCGADIAIADDSFTLTLHVPFLQPNNPKE